MVSRKRNVESQGESSDEFRVLDRKNEEQENEEGSFNELGSD